MRRFSFEISVGFLWSLQSVHLDNKLPELSSKSTIKMLPLPTCQRAFPWFCIIYTDNESLSSWQKRGRKVFRLVFAVTLVMNITLLITSSLKLVSNDLEESVYAICQLFVVLVTFNAFITMLLTGSKVSNILEKLTRIYEKCKAKRRILHSQKYLREIHFESSEWKIDFASKIGTIRKNSLPILVPRNQNIGKILPIFHISKIDESEE